MRRRLRRCGPKWTDIRTLSKSVDDRPGALRAVLLPGQPQGPYCAGPSRTLANETEIETSSNEANQRSRGWQTAPGTPVVYRRPAPDRVRSTICAVAAPSLTTSAACCAPLWLT
jgi:hypothetical protein